MNEELENLSLNKRTDYDANLITSGGQSKPPHYTSTHPELVPIVVPSNNGLPIDGDILLFGSDTYNTVTDALGALRLKLGEDFGLVEDKWAPLWVVDFPMFEELEVGALTPLRHPFTAPSNMTPAELAANPVNAISDAYDMVLNGCELGGGSVRIHNQDMQAEVFKLLGISDEEAKEKFGFLLDALQYGAPPHAGLAFGLDRMVMLMVGADSIRDVMAFPKTSTAACPLTSAPGFANEEQLADLGIQVVAKEVPAAE